MTPLFQNDARWRGLLLGHGPSRIGKAGCVLVSLTMAAREIGTMPDLMPAHTNRRLLEAGCFDGDEIWVARAAPHLGLEAPDLGMAAGAPGDPQVLSVLRHALVPDAENRAPGMALVRVDNKGDGKGHHTILATSLDLYSNAVRCLDPAVGRIDLSFPLLEGVAIWGKGDVRTYRVTGVRPIRKAAQ